MDIYSENIIFHGTKSPNKGIIADADFVGYEVNTTCGDNLKFYIKTDSKGIISDVKFEGEGCSISQASASLLVEELIGMNFKEARELDEKFIHELLGVEINPAREKCAVLSLKTLRKSIS
ncbi:MAG: iron-sulfur cluster assembly scaffold protein [bacterium]